MDTLTMDQLANLAKSKHTTVTNIMKKREAQMKEKDLTVTQVAEQLQHAPGTIYALLHADAFPGAYQSGRGGKTSPWRIPQASVDQYRTARAA